MKILNEYRQVRDVYHSRMKVNNGMYECLVEESVTNYYVTLHHEGWSLPHIQGLRIKKRFADSVSEAIDKAMEETITDCMWKVFNEPQVIDERYHEQRLEKERRLEIIRLERMLRR